MPPDHAYLLLDDLLTMLPTEGFQPQLEARLRLRRLLNRLAQRDEAISSEQLKIQLGILLCQSAEAQLRFQELFEKFVQPYWGPSLAAPSAAAPPVSLPPTPEPADLTTSEPSAPNPSAPVAPSKPVKTQGRSGPIRIELHFPNNNLRVWNTPAIDLALRPLREKEWTAVQEWDLAASIRGTIRAGGIPSFVQRFRKKTPQYLLLIDQQSPRDHLAGLYTDLVLEMNRRDLDAEYYYYDTTPYICWRDPRDPRTRTSVEGLQSQFPDAKLLIVGEVEGLLDFPDLRPSNLALDLYDQWRQVALLSPKSTADWGEGERTLCPLFPVVPANAVGLSALVQQWNDTELFTPAYWKSTYPEPPLADSTPDDDSSQTLDHTIESLYYYLGDNGFQWLCASAMYPEIYWELTKLLSDESIPPDRVLHEWDQNSVWQVALLRLSRISWFRQGGIPTPLRKYLRQYFESELPAQKRDDIRHQLLKVLRLNEDRFAPGSYADVNRAFTIAWYEYERAIAAPHLSDAERTRIEAEFREKGLAKIQLAEIEDVIGRKFYQEVLERAVWPPVPDRPGFQVLWVDDEPKNNVRFQDSLNELFHGIFTNVTSTEAALAKLAERGFDLIVSDVSRYRRGDAGEKMLRVFREKRMPTPVIFYTTPAMVDRYELELRELGAAGVFSSHEDVRKFMGERVTAKQREDLKNSKNQSSLNSPTQNLSKKYVLIEHITNSRDSISKSKHPAFYDLIQRTQYANEVHHISYHSSIPYNNCIFYLANPIENNARSSMYNVQGTPRVVLNGVLIPATGTLLPEATLQAELTQTTPIYIEVIEDGNDDNRSVTVAVHTVSPVPVGEYKLYIALVEKIIRQTTPNGETEHYNVFRKMLPDINGSLYSPEASGSAATFNANYTISADWKTDEIYVVAFVQNTQTKEILNSGTRFDSMQLAGRVNRNGISFKDLTIEADFALRDGEDSLKKGDFEESTISLQKALNLFTQLKDDAGRANTHQALGKLYNATNNLESALKEFNSASTLYLLLNFNPAYAYALTNVGGVQQKMGLLVEAQKSYEEALEILEELGDEGNLAEVREALSEIEKQQVYSGTIKQLTDKGFGFIVTDETDVFFQYNQLKGVTFDELRIGDSVSFMIEDNPKGTQAINVERDSLSEITNQQNDELQNQATEKKNLEESVTNLYNKQQGLILYYLPTTMQVGETIRCFIRIATIAEMLQKDWEANPVDVQQAIQIADTISMEIKQSAEYEPGEWAFEITRNSLFKQKISRARYTEWIFDVETERVGTYRLMLKITLFEKGKRQSTQMIERQVVVADKPPSPAKKRTQIQKRK